MKKCISIILVFTILINALLPNYILAGKNGDNYSDVTSSKDEKAGKETVDKIMGDGTVSVPTEAGSTDKEVNEKANFGGWIASIIVIIFFPLVYTVRILVTIVAPSTVKEGTLLIPWFTIQGMLTDKIDLVNANIFNAETSNKANNVIKQNVQKWYYAIWVMSIILNMVVLVYIGIRMAMSTVADEKAKYKSQLIAWFQSIVLLFAMHFIIRLIFFVGKILVDMLTVILNGIIENVLSGEDIKNIDLLIFDSLGQVLLKPRGWKPLENFLCYILLMCYQIKFLLMYLKRFFVISFLVIISPLVTVTYSIDKVGDGKAQAFQILLKELIMNVMLQPMHLFLYAVLMGFATNIIREIPLFTILLLIGVGRGEKIIRKILKMSQSATIEDSLTLKKGKGKK
jgi:hypothetical protein